MSNYKFILIILLIISVWHVPAWAQEATETGTNEPAVPQPSRAECELIELDAVQIEGEIAQPNVTITVARQNPIFRKIALEPTSPQGLTDFDFTAEDEELLKAARIVNWSEMLVRPRQ